MYNYCKLYLIVLYLYIIQHVFCLAAVLISMKAAGLVIIMMMQAVIIIMMEAATVLTIVMPAGIIVMMDAVIYVIFVSI